MMRPRAGQLNSGLAPAASAWALVTGAVELGAVRLAVGVGSGPPSNSFFLDEDLPASASATSLDFAAATGVGSTIGLMAFDFLEASGAALPPASATSVSRDFFSLSLFLRGESVESELSATCASRLADFEATAGP